MELRARLRRVLARLAAQHTRSAPRIHRTDRSARTHEGLRPPVFKTGALNRSATPPGALPHFQPRPSARRWGWDGAPGAPAARPRSSRGTTHPVRSADPPHGPLGSNPRGLAPAGFQDRCIEPLCHPSRILPHLQPSARPRVGWNSGRPCGASSLVSRHNTPVRYADSPHGPLGSNPRGLAPAGFQDRCIEPLCHPSRDLQNMGYQSLSNPEGVTWRRAPRLSCPIRQGVSERSSTYRARRSTSASSTYLPISRWNSAMAR